MNAVDTNILIYSSDARDLGARDRARAVMAGLTEPILLWQVACEFIAASRKLLPGGFTPEAAWSQLAELQQAWPLALPTPAVLARAQALHTGGQVAFWDAMLYAACVEAGVTRRFSEDTPGASIDGLEIVNPF